MQNYFRRSRSGCINCREIRVKCDERRPECIRCESRGVHCEGYTKSLQWVIQTNVSSPSSLSSSRGHDSPSDNVTLTMHEKSNRKRGSRVVHSRTCSKSTFIEPRQAVDFAFRILPRQLEPKPLVFLDATDVPLFQHWVAIFPNVTCPDPRSGANIQSIHVMMAHEPESVILPAILAASASHLNSLGLLSNTVVLAKTQKAYNAFIRGLQSLYSLTHKKERLLGAGEEHIPSKALTDEMISASLMLAGNQIMQGADFDIIEPLVRGTTLLVCERHEYHRCSCSGSHPGWQDPMFKLNNPVYRSTVKMLAYFDILSCVPCAQAPMLAKEYWYDETLQMVGRDEYAYTPDPYLGYCVTIFALLGESGALVEGFYRENLNPSSFDERRGSIMDQLEAAWQTLPARCDLSKGQRLSTDEIEKLSTHNSCIAAAVSHVLATKIFLFRATDFSQFSSKIDRLAVQLYGAISEVPMDSPAVALMLWPLWVLGCESFRGSQRRDQVQAFFEQVFERQHIMNVRTGLQALQQRIWTLDDCDSAVAARLNGCSISASDPQLATKAVFQAQWVKYCWDERIRVMLA